MKLYREILLMVDRAIDSVIWHYPDEIDQFLGAVPLPKTGNLVPRSCHCETVLFHRSDLQLAFR